MKDRPCAYGKCEQREKNHLSKKIGFLKGLDDGIVCELEHKDIDLTNEFLDDPNKFLV